MVSDTQPRDPPTIHTLFNQSPIRESIFSYLMIPDFLTLWKTCKKFHMLNSGKLSSTVNINGLLKDFVNDPARFRSRMGQHGALISGIFALDFFELGHTKVPCLDVFVKDGDDANLFTAFVEDSERYQSEDLDTGANPNIKVYSRIARSGTKLRIHRTAKPPLIEVLTAAPTTAHTNFITWNKAYSLFPRQTIMKRQLYPLRAFDDFISGLNALKERGWTNRNVVWPDIQKSNVDDVVGLRCVGDRSSLIIPLCPSNTITPVTPVSAVELAQFKVSTGQNLEQPLQLPRESILKINALWLDSPALKDTYFTASEKWHDHLYNLLERWSLLELHKVNPEIRDSLSNKRRFYLRSSKEFNMPLCWDYADDQVAKWYSEWEQMPHSMDETDEEG